MAGLIIYTKTGCPYCKKAVEEYQSKGIPFTEINTSLDKEALTTVKEKYGASKVPIIVEDDKLVRVGFGGGG
ncbi:MAG: glutaredoxin family protein [Bacillota bacterium]|jgi:glutaredoxin 3